MADPLQRYFERINPIMFPTGAASGQAQKLRLFAAWDALSRQLFTIAPRQLDRTRSYINGLDRIADRG